MLKAIAIDDEPVALQVIESLTDKVTYIDMLGYFTSGYEASNFIKSAQIDLIFLDIKMPTASGFDFLKTLNNPPMVIFTTAYGEHALQGFEMDAVDYLLKPFSLARFLKACNKAYVQLSNKSSASHSDHRQSFVYIKSAYENIKVEFKDILYVEGLGNYVQFVLQHRKIVTRLTMVEAEALLSPHNFMRCHRSYIIPIEKIDRFDKKSIVIRNIELPMGPHYVQKIEKIIIKR